MEFPFGHNHHRHHHHRRDHGDDEYPPPAPPSFEPSRPPPPSYYGDSYPPPSQVHHTSHFGGEDPYPPPPPRPHHFDPNYFDQPPPPPPQNFGYPDSHVYPRPPPDNTSSVTHISHETLLEENRHRPHFPSFIHHHSHHGEDPELSDKPTVRVFCKAETNYSLSIRDGEVILAPSDPSNPFQHWIKDEKYSTKVKDEEGFPAFALVNKATGEAIKHSIGATHPVRLIPYNPDFLDESVLWTLSRDTGEDYRAMRMVNNIRLNVDAFNGDKDHGGVRDGTKIVLWEWAKGENQRWKIVRY